MSSPYHPYITSPTYTPTWQSAETHHLHNHGDMFTFSPQTLTPTWHDLTTLGSETPNTPPPDIPPPIRPHQIWAPSLDSTTGTHVLIETMGYISLNPPLLNIKKHHTSVPTEHLTSLRETFASHPRDLYGGATALSLPIQEALGTHPRRVFLKEPKDKTNLQRNIQLITQPSTYTTPPYSLPTTSWTPKLLTDTLPLLGNFDVFTDGSWTPTNPIFSHIMQNSPTFKGTAGLVIISKADNWMDLPIIALHINNGISLESTGAFSMEILAILTALSIFQQTNVNTTIHSDCESAVKKLNRLLHTTTSLRASAKDVPMISAALKHLKQRGTLKWIKGHPEKTQPDDTYWTREMWGNHLADRAAEGILLDKTFYQHNNDSIYVLNIVPLDYLDARTITPLLCPNNTWYFGREDKQLTSYSILDAVRTQRLNEYLVARDRDRAIRKQPPKWTKYNITLASIKP